MIKNGFNFLYKSCYLSCDKLYAVNRCCVYVCTFECVFISGSMQNFPITKDDTSPKFT